MGMTDEQKGGVLAGAVSIGGQLINWGSQGSMNKKTRQWNESMYDKQRANALADWDMQNAYNSPASQMQRYKDAGLNPNLIYGQSQTAQPVRSTDQKAWNPQAPSFNPSSALGAYYDVQQKSAQIDLLKSSQEVQDMDKKLKAAQILKLGADTDSTTWKTNYAQSIADISTEALLATVNKNLAQTKYTLDENARREAMQAPNLIMAAEKILLTRAQTAKTDAERAQIYQRIDLMKKDGKLKDFELELNHSGMTKGDPVYFRWLNELLDGDLHNIPTPKEFKNMVNGAVGKGAAWLKERGSHYVTEVNKYFQSNR